MRPPDLSQVSPRFYATTLSFSLSLSLSLKLSSLSTHFHLLLHLHLHLTKQYVLGASSLFALLNALEGVIMSLLSKVVSPELARGTFNSGLLATEAGTLGRVFGDCMLTYLSERQSQSGAGTNGEALLGRGAVNALFLPVAIGILVSILLVYRFYEQLKS